LREAASSGALVTIAVGSSSTRVGGFVRAAIDIHKAVFPAAVLDPASGDISKERFKASRKAPVAWIENWDANLDVVAIEATIGWRWVAIEGDDRLALGRARASGSRDRGAVHRREAGERASRGPGSA
jgi:hypothetical protein